MASAVLDASALLALLNNEPGTEKVKTMLPGSLMSTVNYAEVATVLHDIGVPLPDIDHLLSALVEQVIPLSVSQSLLCASLRSHTKHKGLSLGDRACLALAQEKNLPAITADKVWADLDIGVSVILIR